MKVLLSWLREFAPLDADAAAVGRALSSLGTAVESMERLGVGLDGIVVARVVAVRAHPDADKIQLVDVDHGDGDALQVCCGAFNMAVGDLVPLATIGTTMPYGLRIERRRLRGQWSNGMLCSAPELGLGGDPGSILVLPESLSVGAPLKEALGIEDDVLYDLEVNPNRPDAMSVAGVARDLAAHFRVPFTLPSPKVDEGKTPISDLATVEVVDPERCGRFVARVLRGVTVGPSPTGIANRLTLLGMRPINNVVDASNYVMLELGAPNHPYDLARVGGGGLRVRRAVDGERLVTLDGVERRFTAEDLLICDATDRPVGIAGIMGGADAEISEATSDVLLEMAWWAPMPLARTARRLGLRTEASARFEKGTDPDGIGLAVDRFVELVGGAVSDVASGTIDVRGELPDRRPVRVRTARVNSILGTELSAAEVQGYLEPIGFDVEPVGDDNDVVVPSFRYDTTSEIDVIEEVARHHGYERIAPEVPPSVHAGFLTDYQKRRRTVRATLVGLGVSEAMPLPFLAPGDLARAGLSEDGITITNPLVAEESVLRTSLLPGLLKAVAYNASHRNHGVGLFEIGHVYRPPEMAQPLPDESEYLAVAQAGAEAPAAVETLGVIVSVLGHEYELVGAELSGLHPTRTARVCVHGDDVGSVGEVDPDVLAGFGVPERVAWLELDLGRLLELPADEHGYRPVSKFPSSDVDLAFEVVDRVPAAAVERTLREATVDLVVSVRLFDVYRGPGVADGSRSLAYRLRLQALDRTLTDADVAAVRARAIDAVETAHAARLRA